MICIPLKIDELMELNSHLLGISAREPMAAFRKSLKRLALSFESLCLFGIFEAFASASTQLFQLIRGLPRDLISSTEAASVILRSRVSFYRLLTSSLQRTWVVWFEAPMLYLHPGTADIACHYVGFDILLRRL